MSYDFFDNRDRGSRYSDPCSDYDPCARKRGCRSSKCGKKDKKRNLLLSDFNFSQDPPVPVTPTVPFSLANVIADTSICADGCDDLVALAATVEWTVTVADDLAALTIIQPTIQIWRRGSNGGRVLITEKTDSIVLPIGTPAGTYTVTTSLIAIDPDPQCGENEYDLTFTAPTPLPALITSVTATEHTFTAAVIDYDD
ncbi:hypothetical protein NIE88_04010 [Sporolactobacillus shoreicorticis]|uniref:Ig-like domain-containing protein n=1 Tax=Sporolactobacillus shoreicorticis TaxID=1923877 RepID=A0ABW5RX51_9BACL|nr:hypothetical protein [Sporolactobacillus shoreicorticis]MCO7124940.1 hypothetical protein [Sporolactobacillus shoreicorticis]